MANSDKDILITPNKGQSALPEIKFVGSGNDPIYLRVLDDNTIFIGDANGSNARNTGSMFLGTASGMTPISSNFLDSPATTSAVTYQPAICSNAGDGSITCYVNRHANSSGSSTADDVQTSSITLMEVSG